MNQYGIQFSNGICALIPADRFDFEDGWFVLKKKTDDGHLREVARYNGAHVAAIALIEDETSIKTVTQGKDGPIILPFSDARR